MALTSRVLQVAVPELDLEVSTGTLGGLITTVEGLLDTIAQNLKNTQVQRPEKSHVSPGLLLDALCSGDARSKLPLQEYWTAGG